MRKTEEDWSEGGENRKGGEEKRREEIEEVMVFPEFCKPFMPLFVNQGNCDQCEFATVVYSCYSEVDTAVNQFSVLFCVCYVSSY
jgi:hypothetical protein